MQPDGLFLITSKKAQFFGPVLLRIHLHCVFWAPVIFWFSIRSY